MNSSFESLTHKMQRAAVSKMVDVLFSHMENDREKTIGHSLDAKVDLYATGEAYELLKPLEKDLPTLLIVSQAAIHEGTDSGMKTERDDLTVAVAAAEGEKCERCWNYDPTVGKDPDHPTLCHRCIEVLSD